MSYRVFAKSKDKFFEVIEGEVYVVDAVPEEVRKYALEGNFLVYDTDLKAVGELQYSDEALRIAAAAIPRAHATKEALTTALKKERERRMQADQRLVGAQMFEGSEFNYGLAVGGLVFGILGLIVGIIAMAPSETPAPSLVEEGADLKKLFLYIVGKPA